MTPEQLLTRLDELGLATTTHRHAPVYTVAESMELLGDLPGGHCKNLLLRDHRRALWLLVTLADRVVNLKALRHVIGSGRLSFAKPAQLHEALGVDPGTVTPFALINDREHRVQVLLDREMMTCRPLNFHPLTNTATTAIQPENLLTFIRDCGHEPRVIDL